MIRVWSLVALSVTLFVGALAIGWVQDVAAPWINEGEAQMRGTVSFDADGGKYRVVTSGPSRPELDRTECEISGADESRRTELGGSGGVNANDRFGVSRVLEFETAPGTTRVTCGDRFVQASTFGRFQIVAADGLVSKAVIAMFVLAGVSLLSGALLLLLPLLRR